MIHEKITPPRRTTIARHRALVLVSWLLVAAAAAQDAPSSAAPATPNGAELMDVYYMKTCAGCDALLGAKGEAIDVANAGRSLRFCSSACQTAFSRDPAAGLARIDAVMIADQRPHYPLTTSLFDDGPLGERPLAFIWGNRLFLARDEAERQRVLADPAAAICKLDRAVIAAQRPVYGMPNKCPVQGDILPNESRIDFVVANRMVRVCCARCVRVVKARPYQYLGMVEYANRQAAASRPSGADEP